MERIAFKMKLIPGNEEEYSRRHAQLWPELHSLLKQTGIMEYSIFLDSGNNDLIGYFKIEDTRLLETLPQQPIMKKWWNYMRDIMETNEDNSPKSISLREVFFIA